jgi:hypothetical protein
MVILFSIYDIGLVFYSSEVNSESLFSGFIIIPIAIVNLVTMIMIIVCRFTNNDKRFYIYFSILIPITGTFILVNFISLILHLFELIR